MISSEYSFIQEEILVILHASKVGRVDIIKNAVAEIKQKKELKGTLIDIESIVSARRQEDDLTPLHIASICGHADVIRQLLNLGANPCLKPRWGEYMNMTAYQIGNHISQAIYHIYLFEQVAMGHIKPIINLLYSGVPITITDGSKLQDTPLHWATSFNHIEVIKILLAKGIDINLQNNQKQTCLHLACKNNHMEIIHLLLSEGANIALIDHTGLTAKDILLSHSTNNTTTTTTTNNNNDNNNNNSDDRNIHEMTIFDNPPLVMKQYTNNTEYCYQLWYSFQSSDISSTSTSNLVTQPLSSMNAISVTTDPSIIPKSNHILTTTTTNTTTIQNDSHDVAVIAASAGNSGNNDVTPAPSPIRIKEIDGIHVRTPYKPKLRHKDVINTFHTQSESESGDEDNNDNDEGDNMVGTNSQNHDMNNPSLRNKHNNYNSNDDDEDDDNSDSSGNDDDDDDNSTNDNPQLVIWPPTQRQIGLNTSTSSSSSSSYSTSASSTHMILKSTSPISVYMHKSVDYTIGNKVIQNTNIKSILYKLGFSLLVLPPNDSHISTTASIPASSLVTSTTTTTQTTQLNTISTTMHTTSSDTKLKNDIQSSPRNMTSFQQYTINIQLDTYICPKPQSYRIQITSKLISIYIHDYAALYYSLYTLIQIIELHSEIILEEKNLSVLYIPYITIVDTPDIIHRSVLWSNHATCCYNTQATIEYIQFLSKLRINRILYKLDLHSNDTPMNPLNGTNTNPDVMKIQELIDLCHEYYIDIIPAIYMTSPFQRLIQSIDLSVFNTSLCCVHVLYDVHRETPSNPVIADENGTNITQKGTDNLSKNLKSNPNISQLQSDLSYSLQYELDCQEAYRHLLQLIQETNYTIMLLSMNEYSSTILSSSLGDSNDTEIKIIQRPYKSIYPNSLHFKPILALGPYIAQLISHVSPSHRRHQDDMDMIIFPNLLEHSYFYPTLIVKYLQFMYAGLCWNYESVIDMLQESVSSLSSVNTHLDLSSVNNNSNTIELMENYTSKQIKNENYSIEYCIKHKRGKRHFQYCANILKEVISYFLFYQHLTQLNPVTQCILSVLSGEWLYDSYMIQNQVNGNISRDDLLNGTINTSRSTYNNYSNKINENDIRFDGRHSKNNSPMKSNSTQMKDTYATPRVPSSKQNIKDSMDIPIMTNHERENITPYHLYEAEQYLHYITFITSDNLTCIPVPPKVYLSDFLKRYRRILHLSSWKRLHIQSKPTFYETFTAMWSSPKPTTSSSIYSSTIQNNIKSFPGNPMNRLDIEIDEFYTFLSFYSYLCRGILLGYNIYDKLHTSQTSISSSKLITVSNDDQYNILSYQNRFIHIIKLYDIILLLSPVIKSDLANQVLESLDYLMLLWKSRYASMKCHKTYHLNTDKYMILTQGRNNHSDPLAVTNASTNIQEFLKNISYRNNIYIHQPLVPTSAFFQLISKELTTHISADMTLMKIFE